MFAAFGTPPIPRLGTDHVGLRAPFPCDWRSDEPGDAAAQRGDGSPFKRPEELGHYRLD